MRIKRIISMLLIHIGLIVTFQINVSATTVSYWHSNKDYASYNIYGGSYYVYEYSSDSTFNQHFRNALTNATAQWNNLLPISISETSFNYAVNYIFSGNYNELISAFPSLDSTNTGLTHAPRFESPTTTVTYSGGTKKIYKIKVGAKMCVVNKNRTLNQYKKTTLHEMGHLFGWNGHSSNTADIMYGTGTSITSLTTRDKRHITQIYDLFY